MEWLFCLISVLIYLAVAYQDFRYREFNAVFILLLIVSNVFLAVYSIELEQMLEILKWNVLFLAFLFGVLYLYMAVREGSFRLSETRIGLGDVLIVLTMIPLFSPILFRLVFLSSAVSGLVLALLYKNLKKENEVKVPFAGLISIVCAVLIVVHYLRMIDLFDELII